MKVAIYGAAKYGMIFCKELEKNGYTVEYFIDEYIDKKRLLNKKILRIKNIKDNNITIFNSATTSENAIKSNLKKYGIKDFVSFQEVLTLVPSLLPQCLIATNMWYREEKQKMLQYDQLNLVQTLLKHDTVSSDIFKNIIKLRENTSSENYIKPMNMEMQYFPNDIFLFKNIKALSFIDCGAFTGDTIHSLLNFVNKQDLIVSIVVAFEADSTNIGKLNKEIEVQKNLSRNTNFIVYPAGVWSENKFLHFSNDGNSASAITDTLNENTVSIPVFSLDATVKNMHINYIKMDIEGAELEAIKGAKEIISEQSPILAICLYHKPSHLWEIPLLINEINPNYDMYIRVYGHLGLETVLYCVPKG